MWINIKTGYTFKAVYGHLDKIAEKCKKLCDEEGIKEPYGGIADLGNTFAHIPWRKACKKAGIKPIYGVQIPVVDLLQKGERRSPYNWMTFIAKTQKGLQEIYELVDISFQQFYYRQRITYDQVNSLSLDVEVFSGVSPRTDLLFRNIKLDINPSTPNKATERILYTEVACIDNFYPDAEDDIIYEPFADDRLRERKTTPIHILSKTEWMSECNSKIAFENLLKIASECNVKLPEAPMVKYIGKDNIEDWCKKGAKEKGLSNKPEYIKRYKYEINLIKDKDYADYFLVIADGIRYAKTKMAVGPARGSSAGSLVCYLMGITEIDPLEYGLYFERFIDINRFDLPDIDIDFQDNKRHLVVKYFEKKYGKENVAQLGNINRMKPKSAIARFAKALGVPLDDVEELKDSIMERSGGDARANECMEDTFTDTDIGKNFIENYPTMEVVKYIENHPSHTGVHAAAILVCNSPITNFCGVNSRDNKRIGMLDKKDAEAVGLLKIDALGLRTMTILAGVCDQIDKPYSWLYEIPVDDDLTYKIFDDGRYNGIFQFEGSTIQILSKSIKIETLSDIAAVNALGRPGPLVSGGAYAYIDAASGLKKIEYLCNHPAVISATKETYGIVMYQEQMLSICREYGKLSWADTSDLRKAASKSLGDEFFDKFKESFINGAMGQGETEEDAKRVWKAMHTFGSWAFNKCLSGKTKIKIANSGSNLKSGITIKELYDKYIINPSPWIKGRKMMPALVSLNEKKGRCYPQTALSIIKNEQKNCNRYIFQDGTITECTPNHKFLINGEWKEIGQAKLGALFASSEYSGTGYKGTEEGHGHAKGKKYKTPNEGFMSGKKDLLGGLKKPNDLEWLCPSCHKIIHYEKGRNKRWSVGHKVVFKVLMKIEPIGVIDTYDIEMPEHHNFVLENGLITHNSHAVSYGLISYLCAYMKAHHPLEFLVSNLNNTNSDRTALKILRDAVVNDSVKYEYFNAVESEVEWCVKKGILYGGFMTLHGLGIVKAKKAVKDKPNFQPGIVKSIKADNSPFKYLYPAKELYGDYYTNPRRHQLNNGATKISETDHDGTFTVIGCLIRKRMRDANEAGLVSKRKGKILTGATTWLNINIEDDTGEIICKIKKEDYVRFGKIIAETGKEEKDWYMVHGQKINGWSIIFVKNIKRITRKI